MKRLTLYFIKALAIAPLLLPPLASAQANTWLLDPSSETASPWSSPYTTYSSGTGYGWTFWADWYGSFLFLPTYVRANINCDAQANAHIYATDADVSVMAQAYCDAYAYWYWSGLVPSTPVQIHTQLNISGHLYTSGSATASGPMATANTSSSVTGRSIASGSASTAYGSAIAYGSVRNGVIGAGALSGSSVSFFNSTVTNGTGSYWAEADYTVSLNTYYTTSPGLQFIWAHAYGATQANINLSGRKGEGNDHCDASATGNAYGFSQTTMTF